MNYYRLIEVNNETFCNFSTDLEYHIGQIVRWPEVLGTWIVLRKL